MTKQTETPKAEALAKVSARTPVKIIQEMDFGKFYYRIQGGQIMAPIRSDMTLFEKMGHLYKMPGGKWKTESEDEDSTKGKECKFMITAPGYIYANKGASISILTAQHIIVDGQERPNPHIERNPKTKGVENVAIRKMGIGYSPAGNIVVVDNTLFYNIYTYFIQSIQAKMKRMKWTNGRKTDLKEFPNCARYGIAGEKPKDTPGRWVFYVVEPPLGIWANYDDQAIIDCLEEHIQRQKFGDRIAQKIVERNIFKNHPAIGIGQVKAIEDKDRGWNATITVYGWRNENMPKDLTELVRQTEEGAEKDDFEVKAETIITAEPEEEAVAMADVTGEDKAEDADQGNPATDKEPPTSFFEKGKVQK